MKKEQSRNRLILGVVFLCILSALFFFGALKDVNREKLIGIFKKPSFKKEIASPLPAKDPSTELASLLAKLGLEVATAPIATDSALLVSLSDGSTVLFDPSRDLLKQVISLQIINVRLTIEGRKAKRIDLRFSDPVVVY